MYEKDWAQIERADDVTPQELAASYLALFSKSKLDREAEGMSTEMLLFGTGVALMVPGAQGAGEMPGYTPNYNHYSSTVHTWSNIAIGEFGRP
jgi:hypothetical protein